MPEVSRFFGIAIRLYYNDSRRISMRYMASTKLSSRSTRSLCLEASCREERWRSFWNGLHCIYKNFGRDWEMARHGSAPAPIAPLD
jgi:hypothetical protein